MANPEYMNLQPTEAAILQSAATLFAARIGSGQVNPENEQQLLNASVEQALQLARLVDHQVRTSGEMG